MSQKSVVPGFRFDAKAKRAHFEVTLPQTLGRVRRRKTVKVLTRDQALVLFRQFRAEALAGRGKEPEFFAEYVRRFWPLIRMRLSEKTAGNETWMIEKLLLPFFGNHQLEKINLALVRDFVALLRSRSYAPSSANGVLSVLRKILNDAVAREVIPVFPVRGRLPREKEVPLRLELSQEERVSFLRSFDDETRFRDYFSQVRSRGRVISSPHFGGIPRAFGGGLRPEGEALGYYLGRFRETKPFFVVALETGLRRSDLFALRWSSVDLKSGWIRVVMQKTRREAVIPISHACRAALLDCRRRSLVSESVFVSADGTPLSSTTVLRHFSLAKKLAGITRRFRFHDLRHTFGSTLASRGVSLQVIAKALGHTSITMSERYARPSQEALQEIRRALDRECAASSP